MAKEAKITGSLLRPLPNDEKSLIARDLRAHAWPLIASGHVRPLVRQVFALEDAALAHGAMEHEQHQGKLLLRCA